jgi:hypothetical protein
MGSMQMSTCKCLRRRKEIEKEPYVKDSNVNIPIVTELQEECALIIQSQRLKSADFMQDIMIC